MIYLGIDPGQSGGIAWSDGMYHDALAMPKTERDTCEQLKAIVEEHMCAFAVIEAVHAFPGQGVVSSFSFGQSYGGLRMALIATGIPFEAVTPVKWMRALGIPSVKDEGKTDRKRRLKARAQELFPSLKITNATADALLIAEYARRIRTAGAP